MDEGEEHLQPMLRSLSYNLPPPHRLGSSHRLQHRSDMHSSSALATPTNCTARTLQQLSSSLGLRYTGETESEGINGSDEPDLGRELRKKAALSTRASARVERLGPKLLG